MKRTAPMILAALAIATATACGRHDAQYADPGSAREQGTAVKRDSALAFGPGDVQITNADSSVDMALVGQQIIVRLSDKTMAKVREGTDTTKADSGFGGSIEKMVKRTVASALGQQYTYPLADVRDARYENGTIMLDVNGRQPRLLANTQVGGKKVLESFRPEDAQRFVAAVNARKGQKRAE
jgi:hypothetical protein